MQRGRTAREQPRWHTLHVQKLLRRGVPQPHRVQRELGRAEAQGQMTIELQWGPLSETATTQRVKAQAWSQECAREQVRERARETRQQVQECATTVQVQVRANAQRLLQQRGSANARAPPLQEADCGHD